MGSLISMLSAMRKCESLELMRSWHQQYGKTFQSYLGRPIIITIEPKNVQTILALKFKDFELGHYRNKALAPLLGQGIFASDGEIWEHSRALVRPNFARNQVADIEIYERHVSKVIANIPSDGSTVDLQELFYRMVSLTRFSIIFFLLLLIKCRQSTRLLSSSLANPLIRSIRVLNSRPLPQISTPLRTA
jgi:cytochrome P450